LDDNPARTKNIRDEYSPESERDYKGLEPRLRKLVVPVAIVCLSKPEISSLKEIGRCPREEREQGPAENVSRSNARQKVRLRKNVKAETIDFCHS